MITSAQRYLQWKRRTSCFFALLGLLLGGCGGQSDGDPSGNVLDAEQAHTVDTVVNQVGLLTSAMTGSSFAADAQLPNARSASRFAFQQGQSCPVISTALDLATSSFELLVDYMDGCSPGPYADAVFSGAMTGIISFENHSITLVFDNFSNGEAVTSGQIEYTFMRVEDTVFIEGTIDLSKVDGAAIDGDGAWSVNSMTGVIMIERVEGTVMDQAANPYSILYDALVSNPAAHGNFIPESGSVTIGLDGAASVDASKDTIVITFTENSPSTGIVRLSINGSRSFEYQTTLLNE